MATEIHFINVGQGNMNLIICDNGEVILYDCNIIDDTRNNAMGYLRKVLPLYTTIDVFVNSHRDGDHMKNVIEVHKEFPISEVWDSGQSGTTPSDSRYQSYMRLKNQVGSIIQELGKNGQQEIRILPVSMVGGAIVQIQTHKASF